MKALAGQYRFNPRPDMTLQELIELIRISKPIAHQWFVDMLPSSVARHFDLVEKDEE